MRFWPRTLRLLMSAFVAFVVLLMSGTLIPRNAAFRQTPDGVPMYVVSNGFHTDLVLPILEPRTHTNWLQRTGNPALQARFAGYEYIAFGWGNEAFYLESYGGRMPKLGTVLRAVLPARTLMHVGFYRGAPRPRERVVPLRISVDEYRQLTSYIEQSFRPDSLGNWALRNEAGYSPDDFFFRAKGRYHALRTCNDWTNQGLHRAGIRAALKAPLAASVLYQVRQAAKKSE
ncbi:hypothetical protein ASU33_14120 [Solirubrum puertoriconensis]|uniref:Urease-associated protein n=2 Tax=Solirubrum puertoriconensis TaxID=1751427 RepID=A0A9X0L4C2_SOLP1|nr:hypothetical protein ASU33_14120 [Solirubrum puertoriconensis]